MLKFFLFSSLTVVVFSNCQSQTTGDLGSYVPQLYFQLTPNMFPSSWYENEINAKTIALSEKEVDRSKRCLKAAIEKYPEKVIAKNLDRVYFLSQLNFYDLDYGGTYYRNTVYLTNKGIAEGYTDEWMQQSFHHEFSSILLNNYRDFFNEIAWLKCNASDFEYGSGGANAIAGGKSSMEFDAYFNQKGLLNQYSAAELEEDFNEFSENLFCPHKGFKEVLEKYESLRKKRDLLIEFYQQIHPVFTPAFFDEILSGKVPESLNDN